MRVEIRNLEKNLQEVPRSCFTGRAWLESIFTPRRYQVWGVKTKFFNFVVCNPCQSSPSLTILVPIWLIIISLVFFYLCKVVFSGFFQFNGNFVHGQNNSKYLHCAPLKGTTKAPDVNLTRIKALKGTRTSLLAPKRYNEHPLLFYPPPPSPPGTKLSFTWLRSPVFFASHIKWNNLWMYFIVNLSSILYIPTSTFKSKHFLMLFIYSNTHRFSSKNNLISPTKLVNIT